MARHKDVFATETKHATAEQVSEFSLFNDAAADDLTVSDLFSDVSEIKFQKPVIVALANANKPDHSDGEVKREGTVDAVFDEAVCEVAPRSTTLAGIKDAPIALYKLRSLLLKSIRDLKTYDDLAAYLNTYSTEELAQFGLQQARKKSTYRKAAKELANAGLESAVDDAAFIAAHALFANGVSIPATVKDAYDLSYSVGPDASAYPVEARDFAVYSMVAELLDIVVEHLDLQRAANKSRALETVVGGFARAAADEMSIEEYHHRARHQYDLSDALKGPTIREHIGDLKFWQVEEMFQAINQDLLEYILDSGIIERPTMSYDLVDLQSRTEGSNRFQTEDGRWRFASLAFTDSDVEFAYGMRVLKSESQRDKKLKVLLRKLAGQTKVGLLLADRGFDGKDDIVACRTHAKDSWLVFAQDDRNTAEDSDFERLREELEPGGSAVIESAGYENLNPPVRLVGFSGAREDDDSIEPIRAFYTGIPVSDAEDEEQTIQDLNFTYNQRAKIEVMFRLSKNDLDVGTRSDNLVKQTFYYKMSTLYYNIYKIVNTVPAPNGLELDISQKELLGVIQNIAFDGPTQPTAQDRLQEGL